MPRQSKSYDRISGIRNPDLLVIACEGEKTEQRYFDSVKNQLDELGSAIKIEILPKRAGHLSSPKDVIEQMNAYKKEYGIKPTDQLCLVIDRDHQSWREGEIADVARVASQKGYLLALSNPCFELWLLLHYEVVYLLSATEHKAMLENKRNLLKQRVDRHSSGILPPTKSGADFTALTNYAIAQARLLDSEPSSRWPNGLATRVYLIMEKVMERKHVR